MPRSDVAEFSIELLEVLAADGTVDDSLEPSLSDHELLEMYRTMRRARRLDERAIALQRRGELGTYAPAIGQEAAQVGSAFALSEDDWVVPAFREQGVALARGAPMDELLAYAMGMEEGADAPAESRMLPPAIPVGSQALHAAGIGWGYAIRDEPVASITYFGDGATSTGDVYEALNFAGVYDSRTVFLCQNNQYAISTPRSQQSRAETLAQKAIAAGLEGVQVDGNDVLAVYAVTRDALQRARDGDPVLIEALTYRRSMHTTSDDPRKYRTEEEEADWEAKDPLVRFETYLRNRDVLTDSTVADIDDAIEEEIDDAVRNAKAARERLDPGDMFRFAYHDLPPGLTEQFEAFRGESGDE